MGKISVGITGDKMAIYAGICPIDAVGRKVLSLTCSVDKRIIKRSPVFPAGLQGDKKEK